MVKTFGQRPFGVVPVSLLLPLSRYLMTGYIRPFDRHFNPFRDNVPFYLNNFQYTAVNFHPPEIIRRL